MTTQAAVGPGSLNDVATILGELRARDAEPSDMSLINTQLTECLWRFWPYRAKRPEFARRLRPTVSKLLEKIVGRSQMRIVEHKTRIVAWAIIDREEPVVHYAFTIQPLRRLGICSAVLSDMKPPWRYWADTGGGAKVAKSLGGDFDPFALTFLLAKE